MGTKTNPGSYDCYKNALPDEPLFVLTARDPTAPTLIDAWADMRDSDIAAGVRPAEDRAMTMNARLIAQDMRAWRVANPGKWRSPQP